MGLGGIKLVVTWPGVEAQNATCGLFFLNFNPNVSLNVEYLGAVRWFKMTLLCLSGAAVISGSLIPCGCAPTTCRLHSPRDKTKTHPHSHGKSWGQQKLKGERAIEGPGRKMKSCQENETRWQGWRPGPGTYLKWWLREATEQVPLSRVSKEVAGKGTHTDRRVRGQQAKRPWGGFECLRPGWLEQSEGSRKWKEIWLWR